MKTKSKIEVGKMKRERRTKFSKRQELYICHEYLTGIGMTEIAEEWNIALGTVFKILKRNGVKARGQKK